MLTSSKKLPHEPPETVHLKIFVPTERPDTRLDPELRLVKLPLPLTTDQVPELGVADMIEELEQVDWSMPAFG